MGADTNVVITDGTKIVTIDLTNYEESLEKTLNFIIPPQSSANWDSGPKDTKIVDLLRVRTNITINGTLSHGDGGVDSSVNPDDKAEDLKSIFNGGGTFTLQYKGEDIVVNATKLNLTKAFNKGVDTTQDEVGYEVILNVVEGINI